MNWEQTEEVTFACADHTYCCLCDLGGDYKHLRSGEKCISFNWLKGKTIRNNSIVKSVFFLLLTWKLSIHAQLYKQQIFTCPFNMYSGIFCYNNKLFSLSFYSDFDTLILKLLRNIRSQYMYCWMAMRSWLWFAELLDPCPHTIQIPQLKP